MRLSVERRLLMEFESAGKRQGWWDAGGLVIACSGGGDSMALLALARKVFKGRIIAAHLEHGLRGEASLADAKFVEDYCRDSGIPCYIRRSDVSAERMKGESCESAGRRIRYEFFEEVRSIEKIPFIATAHNAEDVTETVAHHFFRGTGIAGLSGISGLRGHIVRPIVRCGREDLRIFLKEQGIPWREDETNALNHYTRNKIRNQLMPWVRNNINSSAVRAITGLADECEGITRRAGSDADVLLRLISRHHPFALAVWDTRSARRLSDMRLSEAVRLQGSSLGLPVLDRHRTLELCGLIRKGERARFQWSGEVEVCCDNSFSGWITRDMLTPPEEQRMLFDVSRPAEIRWGPWLLNVNAVPGEKGNNVFRSVWEGRFISRDGNGVLAITDANRFLRNNKTNFHVKIPWWSTSLTPFISWESENSSAGWLPGVRSSVHGEGDYVIMIHACALVDGKI